MTDDDRIDFDVLDVPTENLVARVNAGCAPLVASRRRNSAMIQLAGWRWPMLAAAIAVAAASAFVLARAPEASPQLVPAARSASPRVLTFRAPLAQLATTLGVPPELASRLTRHAPPRIDELVPEVAP